MGNPVAIGTLKTNHKGEQQFSGAYVDHDEVESPEILPHRIFEHYRTVERFEDRIARAIENGGAASFWDLIENQLDGLDGDNDYMKMTADLTDPYQDQVEGFWVLSECPFDQDQVEAEGLGKLLAEYDIDYVDETHRIALTFYRADGEGRTAEWIKYVG